MITGLRVPAVSVLMTAYNREAYVAEAIKSVLESDFTDFELIVVDDGSTDRTVDIARDFAASDSRVQVHVNPSNLGDYPNRNRAAGLARGEYLKYLDSDDYIYPHGLGVMVDFMRRFPDAGMGLQRPPLPDRPYPLQLDPVAAYREQFLGAGLFAESPTTSIYRTVAFREVGGFSGRRYVGDIEIALNLAARFPTVKLPVGLAWSRIHPDREYNIGQAVDGYAVLTYTVLSEALTAVDCPLRQVDRVAGLRRLRKAHARMITSTAVRRCRLLDACRIMRGTQFSLLDVGFWLFTPSR